MELTNLVNLVIILLSQITLLRKLTFLLASLTVILTVLLFRISFFLLFVFVLHWLTFHWEILITLLSQFSLTFCQTHSKMPPFYHKAFDYFCADWDGLCDHMRDFPWEDIFKLGASAAASEFCVWVQVGIDVYITHCKYQVKPHWSPWFSAACAAAIVHFLFVPTT